MLSYSLESQSLSLPFQWVLSIDLVPNEDADANVVVTELSDWVKQSEMVQGKVDELMAGNKLDAILCVAGGWAGGNAKSKSMFLRQII